MITPEHAKQFKQAIDNAKTVMLSAHVGPDGDTLGSMLALMHVFQAHMPHLTTVDCVISGKVPDSFQFLPGMNKIKNADDDNTKLLSKYDLAICVDCGAVDRMGPAKPYFLNAKQSINIDHHVSNDKFGKINIIDVEASASGEVVAELLEAHDIPINADTATCIYVAMLTDTGGFKYSNTTAKIFDLAAKLTRAGANPEQIYRHVYEEQPKAQTLLLAEAIRLSKFSKDNTLAWVIITKKLLSDMGAKDEYIEGLVETLRRVKPVLVSCVIRETRTGNTKVSLRSDTPEINVSDIMGLWGGGGHKMAAGCTMDVVPTEAEKQLIPVLEKAIADIKK